MTADADTLELYQRTVLDRARNPRHEGVLEAHDGHGVADNRFCGDHIEVFVRRDASGRVAETRFVGRGCAISLAAADLMAEASQGRDAASLHALSERFATLAKTGHSDEPDLAPMRPLGGVADYPSRVRCATLPWSALLDALEVGHG